MSHLEVHRREYRIATELRFGCDSESPFPLRPPRRQDPHQDNAIKENEMNTVPNDQAVLEPDDGELIEVAGNHITIKVASASQLVCDYLAAPSFAGPPLHVHPGFDESYLVLEGLLEVIVGDERVELAPGGLAYVSGLVPHTFRNPTEERTRFLSICSPGGFEHFFRALAAGDRDAIAAVSDRFGYQAVEHLG
jgi:mannose-6-phosphate isomerase-like protein (cupin superfamily)